MTEPTPSKPHPIIPPSAGEVHFSLGGPQALCYLKGPLGPSGRPLPPERTCLVAPWRCTCCGHIYESLDEPGLACGVSFGTLEVMCRPCFEQDERDKHASR